MATLIVMEGVTVWSGWINANLWIPISLPGAMGGVSVSGMMPNH